MKNKKGFTLIELMLVIIMFGILVGIVVIRLGGCKEEQVKKYNAIVSFYHWDKKNLDEWREVNGIPEWSFIQTKQYQEEYRQYVASKNPVASANYTYTPITTTVTEEKNADYWRGYADAKNGK